MNRNNKKLLTSVADLLKQKLSDPVEVNYQDGMIKIRIPGDHLEKRMGTLLEQIQTQIDNHFPDRNEDISILIRDTGSRYENVFKIWYPL